MLTRNRLLLIQGILVLLALVTVNQVWFQGFVNEAEVTVTGAQALSGLTAGLVVQLMFSAIAFYLPGRIVAAVSALLAVGTLWYSYLTFDVSRSAAIALAESGEVSKLSGQTGPSIELAELVTEPTTSAAAHVTLIVLAALSLATILTAFSAPKWQTTKRAKATQTSTKTSFDLWDSQR